jgi:CheY-like chemotaxis protein
MKKTMSKEKKTVFIVDDEEIIRELTCDILVGEGYNVLTAENGRRALEIFEQKGEMVDLVILDMSMPEMDGVQTFDALRKIDPDLKVLVSSGFSEDPSVMKLVEKGARGIITKPYKIDDIASKIRSVFGE